MPTPHQPNKGYWHRDRATRKSTHIKSWGDIKGKKSSPKTSLGAVRNKEINPNEKLPPPPQPQNKAHETNFAKTLLNKKGDLGADSSPKTKNKIL